MDAELLWSALGTLATLVGVGVAWRQMALQARHAPAPVDGIRLDVQGVSVLPPSGRLPRTTRGRDRILDELLKRLRRPGGEFVVLGGMGGVGKTTVALTLADRARSLRVGRRRRVDVWWVSVADPASLISAMLTVAARLGASDVDLAGIAGARPDAPDLLWALLERAPRRWLLVLDNADDPEVLARPLRARDDAEGPAVAATVADGNGWLRPSRRGLVVVTSRDTSPATWGRHARLVVIDPLDEHAATQVLLDWAPSGGDEAEARSLADRLGRLPLALGLAGSYLESKVALTSSFADYERSLDGPHERSRLLVDAGGGEPANRTDPRVVVMRTWELSLDALTERGVPQARALLRLLSCYAASTPIPLDMLDPERLLPLLGTSCRATSSTAERDLEVGLRQLWHLRLVDARSGSQVAEQATLAVHPLIADTNRAHLASATGDDGDVDPGVVRNTAVDLVVADLDRLDLEEPADWPRYRMLTPHLHGLFTNVAPHLDHEHLSKLVCSTAWSAAALDRAGAVAEAERLSQANLGMLSAFDEDDPTSLLARHMFAWEAAMQGRPAEAEAIYRDVLARLERVRGPDHHDTLRTRHELAWITAGKGEWEEAEAIYREVLAGLEREVGPHHRDTLITRNELAWAIASQGRGAEAEAMLRDLIEDRTRLLRPDHPRTLASRHELAWAIAVQGRWAEAEAEYRRVLAARRRILGVDHHETLTTEHELAWTTAMQGRHHEALTIYEAVLTARQRALGPSHPDTIATSEALERLRAGQTTPAHHRA